MRKTPTAADTIAKIAGPACASRSFRSDKCASASPGTPGEVQEDQADGGRREEGEGQEGEDNDKERRMVTYENHGGGGGQRPRLLKDPDGGCFPRMELLQVGTELLGDPRAGPGLIPASPLPRGSKGEGDTEQDLDDLHRGAAAPMLGGAGSPDRVAHGEHDDQRDAPPDQEGGRVDACPRRGEQQDEHHDRARGHAGQQTKQPYGDHQAHGVSRCPARRAAIAWPPADPAGVATMASTSRTPVLRADC